VQTATGDQSQQARHDATVETAHQHHKQHQEQAANAPAKGAGSTSGVESNPFTDALSVMGIGSGY
jgi:hypothetical protein